MDEWYQRELGHFDEGCNFRTLLEISDSEEDDDPPKVGELHEPREEEPEHGDSVCLVPLPEAENTDHRGERSLYGSDSIWIGFEQARNFFVICM